jgi:CheY-like chemotaxis protein
MDDEEIVRLVTREMLRSFGHVVDIAASGEDAIEKFQQAREAGAPFDVLILDLTVRGGMGGNEALDQLTAIEPEVKAIITSGYSDAAILSRYCSEGTRSVLAKPFNVDGLMERLNALLAS